MDSLEQAARETMLERFIRLFGSDLTGKPDDVAFIEEVGEVYNYGFEMAHALRDCGHSVGDYRDPNYIIGKSETYTGSEECIGCKLQAAALRKYGAKQRLEEAKLWRPRIDLRHADDCMSNLPDTNPGSDFCNCNLRERREAADKHIAELEEGAK